MLFQTASLCFSEECVCATYGDPHIKTYDGLAMKFQGICRYTLSKSVAPVCPFNVEVQHERRYGKPKVSYNKYLVFEIYGKSFRMEKNYKLMVSFQSHLWFLKVYALNSYTCSALQPFGISILVSFTKCKLAM